MHGWQVQRGLPTVEGHLTDAVERLLGERVKVWGASRTDAGVHARGQVAAFDDGGRRDTNEYYRALNMLTPRSISVRGCERVEAAFHPRHDARGKVYRYRINDGFDADPMLRDRAMHGAGRLDAEAMHEAAQYFVGEQDFTSVRAAGCDANSPVRKLHALRVRRVSPNEIEVFVLGSAFLKHMVRTIAGTLVEIGRGRRDPRWVRELLAARDRQAAGPTAPACGLTLESIYYPSQPWPAELVDVAPFDILTPADLL